MHLTSLSIYETLSHFYIIGTDATRIKYSVLKLDRNAKESFNIGEPNNEYTKKDVEELLATISSSSVVSSSKITRAMGNTLFQTIPRAYGIVGAVRFLEGYHLIVVTKVRSIAHIGHHEVLKIEEVQSVYIPNTQGPLSPDEQRYAKLFQSVDLTTNFYFCYTYDLSRTLQENTLAQRGLKFNKNIYHPRIDAEKKFIWNDYLLKPFRENSITDKWTLEIVHGYVGQQIVELPCSKLALILIGRRSSEYAGTRFLKRGMNAAGAVANDVETEQIVWDMYSTPSLITGNFTAFVQRRGSIPLFWSQDPSTRGVVGKPAVIVDIVEPNAFTTGAHFKELRRKYGYPVAVVNLVKRRGGEKTRDEKLLHSQFLKTVRYLNEFMKPGKCIDYISFDVAKCNKEGQVLPRLEHIGLKLSLRQGWFQSFRPLRARLLMKHPIFDHFEPMYSEDGEMLLQTGISRTNCVDCLDRTNVAQFGLGKAALGFQLYAMGYTPEPLISSSSEICRVYEDMFDEHGDTMAYQYAGSQLVHSIKTYKKTSAFQERSRDVIQTLSRYYSNTFNDSEKQNGINVFLGLFRPYVHGKPPLWELFSDRYLHFPIKLNQRTSYLGWVENVNSESEGEEDSEWTDWFEEFPEDRKIYETNYSRRSLDPKSSVVRSPLPNSEQMYWLSHRERQITDFELWLKEIALQTNKKTISVSDLNQTAFQSTSFMKLWKTPESNIPGNKNPPFLSSRQATVSPTLRRSTSPEVSLSIDTGLHSTEEVFGFEVHDPSGANMAKYERYAKIAEAEKKILEKPENFPKSSTAMRMQLPEAHEFLPSFFTVDSVYETELLGITSLSMDRPLEAPSVAVVMKWNESADHFAHALNYVYKEKKVDLATKNQIAPKKIETFLAEMREDEVNFRNAVLLFFNKTYELLVDSCKDIAEGLCYSILLKLDTLVNEKGDFKRKIKESEAFDEYWMGAFKIISHLKISKIWNSVDVLMHISEPENSQRADHIDRLVRKLIVEKDTFQLGIQWISLFDIGNVKKEMFERLCLRAHVFNLLNVFEYFFKSDDDKLRYIRLLDSILFKCKRAKPMTEPEMEFLNTVGRDKIVSTISRQVKKLGFDVEALNLYCFRVRVMNDIRHKFFNEKPEGLEEFVIQAIGSRSMEWKVDFLFTILRRNNYREVLCWGHYFGIPRNKWPRDAEKFFEKYRNDTIEFKKRLEGKNVQYVPEDIKLECELYGNLYQLEMIATPAGLEDFMTKFSENMPKFMGIDCEAGTVATGTNSKVTVLQLATEKNLYLIDVFVLKDKVEEDIWKKFFELVFHPSILKVGFSFVSDYIFLVNGFPTLSSFFEKSENSVLCLSRFVQSIMIDMEAEKVIFDDTRIPTNLSLMDVSDAILGIKLDKSLQSCNWSQRPLTMDQMIYAITDALVTLLIERKITEKLINGLGKDEAEKIIAFSHINYVSTKPTDNPLPESPQKNSAAFSDISATVRKLNGEIKLCEEHSTPDDIVFVPDAPFFNFIGLLHNLGLNAVDVRMDHPSRQTREQIKDIRETIANNDRAILITTERRMSNFTDISKDRIVSMPTTGNFIALHFIKKIMMELCLVIDPSCFFTRCEKCGDKNLGKIPAPVYRLVFIMNSMVKKNSVLFKTSFEDVRQAVMEMKKLGPDDYENKSMKVTIAKTQREIVEVYFDFGNFKIKPFSATLIKTENEDRIESFCLKLTEKNMAIAVHVEYLLVCLNCGHVYPKVDSKEVEGIIINIKSGKELEFIWFNPTAVKGAFRIQLLNSNYELIATLLDSDQPAGFETNGLSKAKVEIPETECKDCILRLVQENSQGKVQLLSCADVDVLTSLPPDVKGCEGEDCTVECTDNQCGTGTCIKGSCYCPEGFYGPACLKESRLSPKQLNLSEFASTTASLDSKNRLYWRIENEEIEVVLKFPTNQWTVFGFRPPNAFEKCPWLEPGFEKKKLRGDNLSQEENTLSGFDKIKIQRINDSKIIDSHGCGENEIFSNCPEYSRECEASCDWTAFPESIPSCPRACGESRCVCKEGFVRASNNNGKCVPFKVCQEEVAVECSQNETWAKCGVACEPTCETMYDTTPCTHKCTQPACTCADNYVRFNGKCVFWSNCPDLEQKVLHPSEELASGESTITPPQEPPTTIIPDVETTSLLTTTEEEKTSVAGEFNCATNETVNECGRICEADCVTIFVRDECTECGKPACACQQGFARSGDTCVYWGDCPVDISGLQTAAPKKAIEEVLEVTKPTPAPKAKASAVKSTSVEKPTSVEAIDPKSSSFSEPAPGGASEVVGDVCFGEWRWPRNCRSNCDYKLSWNFNEETDEIEFSLETKLMNNWWSGVGFSKGGSMKNADLIIVKIEGGSLTLNDMFSFDYDAPVDDAEKNVYSPTVIGSFVNGVLRAQFTRRRNTGDNVTDLTFTDDECFHFLFPVAGGRLDAQGNVLKHISTPHVSPFPVCVRSCSIEAPREKEAEPTCDNEFRYPNNCHGDECEYIANWNFNPTKEEVRFQVTSRGIGRWTGIGMSRDGAMQNSDVYTGWVYNGKAYVVDRFAFGRQLPAIDPSDRQDIYDIDGKIEDDYQTISFTRKVKTNDNVTDFSLDGCYYFLFPIGGGRVLARRSEDFQNPRTPIGYHDLNEPKISTSKICICENNIPIAAIPHKVRARRQVNNPFEEKVDEHPFVGLPDMAMIGQISIAELTGKANYDVKMDPFACSDVTVVKVLDGGNSRVVDAFSQSKYGLEPDEFFGGIQSYSDISVSEDNGEAIVRYKRPIKAVDVADHDFITGKSQVFWANGPPDESPVRLSGAAHVETLFISETTESNIIDEPDSGETQEEVVPPAIQIQPPRVAPDSPMCHGSFVYPPKCTSDCRYVVSWQTDGVNAHFQLWSKMFTEMWTGIGFSTEGTMMNADAIVVSVLKDGSVTVTDQFSPGYGRPNIDESQDVFGVSTWFSDGELRANFSRSLITQDAGNDVDLQECQFFLFAHAGGRLEGGSAGIRKHIETPISSGSRICLGKCGAKEQVDPESSKPTETITKKKHKDEEKVKLGGGPVSVPPLKPPTHFVYDAVLRFKNLQYSEELSNMASESSKKVSNAVTEQIGSLLREKWPQLKKFMVLKFAEGSVKSLIRMEFEGANSPTVQEVEAYLKEIAAKGKPAEPMSFGSPMHKPYMGAYMGEPIYGMKSGKQPSSGSPQNTSPKIHHPEETPKGMGETTYQEWFTKVASKDAPSHHQESTLSHAASRPQSRMSAVSGSPYISYPHESGYYTLGGEHRLPPPSYYRHY
ncbi:hypothetical protein FO519_003778 [Halicephalobus sp. NKZ332]|nr:hypothetical protein FO519_003778 [Halicephalobus sp. NKZ332]